MRYVILVRHASRDVHSALAESEQWMSGWISPIGEAMPDFNQPGLPRTLALAARLADELRSASIGVEEIWHSPHTVARQTAGAYAHVLSKPIRECEALDPDHGSASQLAAQIGKRPAGSGALIVVGHQPMLTLIARQLAKNTLPANTLPLGGSESACFEIDADGAATLLWMLTGKPAEMLADLRAKIQSKYDVAKFFLGAFVVNTGFLLSGEIWKIQNELALGCAFVGFALALAALAFTAATLMSYDSLLMPSEFWTVPPAPRAKRPPAWSVMRPPSQAQVVLFYEMVHVWRVFFLPALGLAFAAVAAFLVALAHDSLSRRFPSFNALSLFLLLAVAATAALLLPLDLIYRYKKPKLGSVD